MRIKKIFYASGKIRYMPQRRSFGFWSNLGSHAFLRKEEAESVIDGQIKLMREIRVMSHSYIKYP